jgi:AcrR family transcriptional regulator
VATEPGLRERKKTQTRQLLAETARRLFVERGFEEVSVSEIARAAEVSQATVFNYYPTKEELIYSGLQTFEDELLQTIRERPSGETVLDAFGRFVLQPRGLFTADEEEAEQLLALSRMIAASPALLAREQQIFNGFTEALTELIAAETRAPAGDLRPAVTASALIGIHRALIAYVRERIADDPVDRRKLSRELQRRGAAALTLLANGLGDYAEKR